MSTNPYESPIAGYERSTAVSPNRRSAQRTFRLAMLVLLMPALFNYFAFDTHLIHDQRIAYSLQMAYRTVNIMGIIIGSVIIWFFGLSLLEYLATLTRSLFARNAAPEAWNDAVYSSLKPAVMLAIFGAILWAVWVIGFYYLDLDFIAISYAVGIPAHLLAACLYVPLLVRWYRLARTEPATERDRPSD